MNEQLIISRLEERLQTHFGTNLTLVTKPEIRNTLQIRKDILPGYYNIIEFSSDSNLLEVEGFNQKGFLSIEERMTDKNYKLKIKLDLNGKIPIPSDFSPEASIWVLVKENHVERLVSDKMVDQYLSSILPDEVFKYN